MERVGYNGKSGIYWKEWDVNQQLPFIGLGLNLLSRSRNE